MDKKALFKIQCGLYVAAVATPEKTNGCITNTLMEQSHVPTRLSLTIDKNGFTHGMIMEKRSVGVSALASGVPQELIKRFGFKSGRNVDKFADFADYSLDCNGNPVLSGDNISATFSLTVFDTVDMGTHTIFLCELDDAAAFEAGSVTYQDYRDSMIKK